jgi:hypothetical protein
MKLSPLITAALVTTTLLINTGCSSSNGNSIDNEKRLTFDDFDKSMFTYAYEDARMECTLEKARLGLNTNDEVYEDIKVLYSDKEMFHSYYLTKFNNGNSAILFAKMNGAEFLGYFKVYFTKDAKYCNLMPKE